VTLAAIAPTSAALAGGNAESAETKSHHKIKEVAREFEAMLVRQMLTSANIGGKDKDSAYAGMEVDAIAKGVTAGRGLGIAQHIADALAHESHSSSHSGTKA
jgi:Rod binding domain-containing protein